MFWTTVLYEMKFEWLQLVQGIKLLMISAAICVPLSLCFPFFKGLPARRKGMRTDVGYWLMDAVLHQPVTLLLGILTLCIFRTLSPSPQGLRETLSHLPLLLQSFLVLLSVELLQYWVHRAMHHNKVLWKFHSIHHSSKELDWLSSARLHPVNIIIYSIVPGYITSLAGFDAAAFILYSSTIVFYSPLLHSNLNWTFGPLRYVIGSPVYHRYHHCVTNLDKNLAFYFPFIDILFGTFYMPPANQPIDTGTTEPVPERFFGQLLYPFSKSAYAEPAMAENRVSSESTN